MDSKSELRFVSKGLGRHLRGDIFEVEHLNGYRIGQIMLNGDRWVFFSRPQGWVMTAQMATELASRLDEMNVLEEKRIG
jgi:hypothetical protein